MYKIIQTIVPKKLGHASRYGSASVNSLIAALNSIPDQYKTLPVILEVPDDNDVMGKIDAVYIMKDDHRGWMYVKICAYPMNEIIQSGRVAAYTK